MKPAVTLNKPVRRPCTVNARWQERFIKALSYIPNVTYACEQARVARPTAYIYRNEHPEFAQRWEAAILAGSERLESTMQLHALEGVPRGVWRNDSEGRPVKVETVREFPYGMAMFLMKAHMPEKYKDQQPQVNTQVNVAVNQEPRPLKEAKVEQLLELANEAHTSNGDSAVLTKPLE